MSCLSLLDRLPSSWEYVQIHSGHDVPLKTNAEMVRIFKILNGSNDVEFVAPDRQRWAHPNYFVPYGQAIPAKWSKLYMENNQYGYWISDLGKYRYILVLLYTVQYLSHLSQTKRSIKDNGELL